MERLRRRCEFQAVARGARTGRMAFVLQSLSRSDEGPARLGLTVTKRTARKAVERNRIRRRLREAACLASGHAGAGRDYVLIGRRAALGVAFQVLVGDIGKAFRESEKALQAPKGKEGGRSARSSE